ncbi:hypothetical protein A2130_02665 [Candidatus Woesebacteria bacterium GWC2_33_12]|uniref:Cell envelope-related transcriptional attenuator n=1 Tax=Candidatus Woesebacteria bacterium GW2011_GWB1_33_22 TaxID=1618566 RepID=A0A0G0BZ23_9BACT|nr:MAG: Cell envelope-related transcriptional attenuator [Candidatus Woesebacteria bacterium GW2011_GWC2_33_12]KKP41719.1 MAG: Cell envelope-related transcriptional attenuator [Candidatus Woesebacteria bacterium GW2011_GWA2_33_20]KKP44145.1 MAG: Cell envelope-related transcriptional attenuator [Candidatus Woesebacteria bacterium GW2011_GWB1_33_22]KKP45804.1 MAG: Cell envelope-related transcriptional attenuator [Microgenomates group bacterium GW2011_GWC1_33_28]KKP50227.1 MAG: Cell envelope-relat
MRVIKIVLLFFGGLVVLSIFLIAITCTLFPKIDTEVSILVLGKGGEGHIAPDLTDTIMLVNLNPNVSKISILSLPRDIWIPAIRAKLNTAYHYGRFDLASSSVSSVTGITPNYYVVVDFSLFKDLVDTVGGINVDVGNSFTDEKYPIEGRENDLCDGDKLYKCRYETLRFAQGKQNMDGETALKFVRSRNATNDEGTDIAREARQQKVIEALKTKLLSSDVLSNPKVLKNLYDITISHLETNIDGKTFIKVARLIFKARNNISFLSIPDEFIKISQNDKNQDFQYVFLPETGTWEKFQEWFKSNI